MSFNDPPDRRLRVMHCITRLGLGGAERVAFGIVRALRAEMEPALFCVHGAARDAIGDEMQRELRAMNTPWFAGTRVPMKAGGMLPGGVALARAVRTFRPDIVHFHSETPEACGAVMAQLFPRTRGRAMVRTIHNSVFWRYWPRIGRWCDRRLARADVACVSTAALEEFRRYRSDSGAAQPPHPPLVIYNGVSMPARPPRGAPELADRRRVLFAGRFEFQKGVDVLCRALPLVRLPAGVAGELTLMGHGADEPMLRTLEAAPPTGWRVAVRGAAGSLGAVFPEFDLLVMPSRFEGLGLVAIEATLGGLPVVATAAPGLSEALPADYPWRAAPGDSGSLAECLGAALAETERWAAVVESAQRFARERFSPGAMAAGYRTVYERAIRAGARQADRSPPLH